jgi:DNA-3-methyladenine glycosylase II
MSGAPMPAYLDEALVHLRRRDKRLAKLVARHGAPPLTRTRNPFQSLSRAIVYQQLAGAAAATIHGRFVDLFGKRRGYPTPDEVLAMPLERLRSAGLSQQKASYLLDLAAHFADGRVAPRKLGRLSDDEIVAALLPIKGIGRWTVDMFLLFGLNRPDVLPTGDLGVQHGMRHHFALSRPPKPAKMIELAEIWRPYRSIGSWYMWRAYEDARR